MPVYVRLELNKPVGRHHFFRSGIGTGLGELGFGRIVLGHGTKECLLIYTIAKSSWWLALILSRDSSKMPAIITLALNDMTWLKNAVNHNQSWGKFCSKLALFCSFQCHRLKARVMNFISGSFFFFLGYNVPTKIFPSIGLKILSWFDKTLKMMVPSLDHELKFDNSKVYEISIADKTIKYRPWCVVTGSLHQLIYKTSTAEYFELFSCILFSFTKFHL